MANLVSSVFFSCQADKAFCRALFEKVEQINPNLLPSRFGPTEPLRFIFDMKKLDEILDKHWHSKVFSLYWKCQSKAFEGRIDAVWHAPATQHTTVKWDAGYKVAIEVSHLTRLFKELAETFPLDFAFIHSYSSNESDEYKDAGQRINQEIKLGIPSRSLEKCIPYLPWLTFFGEPYVKLIGAKRLQSAPAYAVEKVSQDLYIVQLTEHFADPDTDYAAFAAVRERVKRHLGEDLFWSPDTTYEGKRAPTFEFMNA